MVFFSRHKKEQEMQDIKDELNRPLDGPIGPQNRPVMNRVMDMDENGEWKEDLRLPNDLEPAIQPPYEPRPVRSRVPSAPMPVEPINRIPMEEEMPEASSGAGAPLFIKVDKYSDLLAHVKEMKIFLATFKQTLDVIDEIETAKDDAIKILRASATRLERVLETADQELLKPEMTEQVEAAGREEAAYVEDTLQSLKDEIDNLKKDLKQME